MYHVNHTINEMNDITDQEYAVIVEARNILNKYARTHAQYFNSTATTKEYFRYHIGNLNREHFMVLFLRNDLSLISADTMFIGSLNEVVVDPIEITRRALILQSNAVIIAHNHPSGANGPSDLDMSLTKNIIAYLRSFNIELLDHVIVGSKTYSMSEEGTLH